jgi:hypothetical protein
VQVKGKGLMETYMWLDPSLQQQGQQLGQQQASGALGRFAAGQRQQQQQERQQQQQQQQQQQVHHHDSSKATTRLPASGALSNGNSIGEAAVSSGEVQASGGSLVRQRLNELERIGYIQLQGKDRQPGSSRRRHSNGI